MSSCIDTLWIHSEQHQNPPTPPSTIDSEDFIDPDDPQRTIPLERYNAMLAVQRNTLYVYGGIHETPNREYTLDDFYTLDLSKLEKFICLKECPIDTVSRNFLMTRCERSFFSYESDMLLTLFIDSYTPRLSAGMERVG